MGVKSPLLGLTSRYGVHTVIGFEDELWLQLGRLRCGNRTRQSDSQSFR
jgi:hypothetical protein